MSKYLKIFRISHQNVALNVKKCEMEGSRSLYLVDIDDGFGKHLTKFLLVKCTRTWPVVNEPLIFYTYCKLSFYALDLVINTQELAHVASFQRIRAYVQVPQGHNSHSFTNDLPNACMEDQYI